MSASIKCKLCDTPNPIIKYTGPIRDGSYGKLTEIDYTVYACAACDASFLSPTPQMSYESDQYRQQYNDTADINGYFSTHDPTQIQHLTMFRDVEFRKKVIADFGCGGGAFLDHISGLAYSTIAIEPFVGYHASLRDRGHRVYQYSAELVRDQLAPKIDLAVSLHVIEHVPAPLDYLRTIRAALVDGGVLYLVTPNHADILLELVFDAYAPFFYRTAHPWYFEARSLHWLADQAGFNNIQILFQQNYDLSNAFCWVRDHQPTGLGKLDLFNHSIDTAWRAFLETSGRSDVVWAVLNK